MKRIADWFGGLSTMVQIAIVAGVAVVVVAVVIMGGDLTGVTQTLLETP